MTDDKTPRLTSAVLVEHEGKYLLAKRGKADGNGLWVIPGGGVDFGESIEAAAVREIREETGLEIALGKYIGAKEVIYPPNGYHRVIFFHHGTVTGGKLNSSDDVTDAGFFSVDEIRELTLIESAKWVFDRLGLIPHTQAKSWPKDANLGKFY